MKISIITVTYNSEETLEETILSVTSQEGVDLEYVIVDGASTDNTLDILKKYRSQIDVLISEPDHGIYDAMNKGIAKASGDVIGILNSDDFYASDSILHEVVQRFESSQCDLLYGDIVFVEKDTLSIRRRWRSGAKRGFQLGWHPPHPSLFVSSQAYAVAGLYNTSFKIAADFEFMLRAFEIHKLSAEYLPKTLVHMRMGGESTGSIQSIFRGHQEVRNAFHQNKMNIPPLYPVYRYVPKLIDYIKR